MTALKFLHLVPSISLILCILQFISGSHDISLAKVSAGQSSLKRNIFKRNIECPSGEYSTNQHCCKLCPKGKYKEADCEKAHETATCKSCIRGKEYMDHSNHLTQCERCRICDHGQGLEVSKNCTEDQNTECQCMEDYFCNSSVPCTDHCYPCTKCEYGVEHECTHKDNTVCRSKGKTGYLGWIALLVIAIPGIVWFVCYLKKRKKSKNLYSKPIHTDDVEPEENELMLLPEDIDLGPFLLDISQKCKKSHILDFVRMNGIEEPEIEAVVHDNSNNEKEQKFQLLEKWYQSHGKKGAYRTLIDGLKKLKLNMVVDEIKKIVSISSHKENVNSSSLQIEDKNECEFQSVEERL